MTIRGEMEIKNCPMCGCYARDFTGKWYKYDNGEQFLEFVCNECVALHHKLLKGEVAKWMNT